MKLTAILILSSFIPLIYLNKYSIFFNEGSNNEDFMIKSTLYYHGTWNYIPAITLGMLTSFLVKYKPKMSLGGKINEFILFTTLFYIHIMIYIWKINITQRRKNFVEIFAYELEVYMVVHKLLYLSLYSTAIYLCSTNRSGKY